MGLFSRRNNYPGSYDTNGNYPTDNNYPHQGNYPMNSNLPHSGTGRHDGVSHHGVGTTQGVGHDGIGHNHGVVHDGIGHNQGVTHDGIAHNQGIGHNGVGHNQGIGHSGIATNDGVGHTGVGHNHGLSHNRTGDVPVNGATSYPEKYDRHDRHHRRGRRGFGAGFGGGRRHDRHNERPRRRREAFDIDSGYYNRRPSFGQWIKMTWLDILTMAVMGAIALGVNQADPAPSRSFPITFLDGEVVFPQFAYPLREEIIPLWAAAIMASLIPIFIILCMQIRIRSFWDVNNGIIGLLYSLISAAVFQVFVKWLIGGLRPHFLTVCNPDTSLVPTGGSGFNSLMFQRNICQGNKNEIDDSLESMPSGHSTAAWAGFLYLFFYLNAKMKVFSNHHPAMWKIIALYAPVLGATLISGSLTIDEFHNWYDVLAGAILGSVMAISAYRMVYASVWDFRFNHIPLTRHTPFSYGAGQAGAGGFESAVFTRKAGWGFEEALGGAPFDAAHGLRGQLTGFNQGAAGLNHNNGNGGGGMLGHGHNKHHHNKEGDLEYNAATATGREHHLGHNDGIRDGHHHDGTVLNNRTDNIHDPNLHDSTGLNNRTDNIHNPNLHDNTGINNRTDNIHDRNLNDTTGFNNRTDNIHDRNLNDNYDHHNQGGLTGTRDPEFMNRPVSPVRDATHHTQSRSVERKAVPVSSGEY